MKARRVNLIILAGSLLLSLTGPAIAGVPGQTLTVTKVGAGHGSVISDVPGISCGATCSYDFPFNTVVTLTATPGATSSFVGWAGDCSGTGDCIVTMDAARGVRAEFQRSYRPDGWIKLCGLSTGCTIDPLPHPWHGKNVYNSTARKQTIRVLMEDGEGMRAWIAVQNDGALADTLLVQGCQGNKRFRVNKVLLGKQKRPHAGTTEVTKKFKNGTLSFDLQPQKRSIFTLNIIAPTTAEGVSYRCPVTISSQHDPTPTDTLAVKITTY